jgi:hypothetical protein
MVFFYSSFGIHEGPKVYFDPGRRDKAIMASDRDLAETEMSVSMYGLTQRLKVCDWRRYVAAIQEELNQLDSERGNIAGRVFKQTVWKEAGT